MGEREDRKARNEALFRSVNERVREIDLHLAASREGWLADTVEFFCECARADCMGKVRMTGAEYEAVRTHASQFIVVPGHEDRDVERVVSAGADYAVIEKVPGERAIAEETDPRG